MSLDPLATIDDVVARAPRALTPDEANRATVLLGSASNRIRRWTGQDFTAGQSTIITPTVDNQIILRHRPVISIDHVGRMNPDGVTDMTFALFTFDGIDRIMLGLPSAVVNAPEWWTDVDWYWRNITYRVTYTHGYAEIPDDVVDVCSQMVVRQVCKPGTEGATSEMIGGYSYRLQADYPAGYVQMTQDDKDMLRPYRAAKNRTIELR